MNILGIETSCDETAAAVVRDGREVLSNVVYTQIPLHQPYGGVVPEIASRAHVEKISQVVGEAMSQADGAAAGQVDGEAMSQADGAVAGQVDGAAMSQADGVAAGQVDGAATGQVDGAALGEGDCGGRSRSESVRTNADGARRHGIDAVAVTYGPGLSPALIVGLNAAKGLAKALNVPLIGINHIEAHLHSPFLYDFDEGQRSKVKGQTEEFDHLCLTSDLGPRTSPQTSDLGPLTSTPALGLAISGGNTMWVDMPEYGRYEVIGETLDDAAGEAFDKAAKLLGLGYPGGLKMDRISAAYAAEIRGQGERSRSTMDGLSSQSNNQTIQQSNNFFLPFPKGRPREGVTALAGLPAELCVSFSGLKTALLRHVQRHPELLTSKEGARDFGGYTVTPDVARVVASYQEAIVQAVADRTRTALRRGSYRTLVLGGGVSLNSRIRAVLTEVCREAGVPLLMAKPKYTGDNAAMIAGLAYYRRNHVADAMTLDANPCLEVGG